MLHKLALRMGRTVGELEATMSVAELASWFAFDQASPIGDERIDYGLAQLALLVCSVGGAKKRGGGAFKIEDFLIWNPARIERQAQSPLQYLRARLGGSVVKKRKG